MELERDQIFFNNKKVMVQKLQIDGIVMHNM